MKWKLTGRYLFSILSIVFIVIIVNTMVLIGLLIYQQQQGIDQVESGSAERFTRSFSNYLTLEDEQPTLSAEGVEALESFGAWLQILNQNGEVISSKFAPDGVANHYSPVELVHKYKYMDDHFNTYFLGEFEEYSYIIGVPQSKEERVTFMMDTTSVITYVFKAIIAITIVDLIIAAIVGLLFSTILTKPVHYMIERISQLKARNFAVQKTKRAGIYKPVFANLNEVSTTLQAHEEERKKLENMRNEWISNVSHDLKTPLASIRGYAELLNEEQVSHAERQEYAEVIERQSLYMKELLDDFNLTLRLRNQELPLHIQEIKAERFTREMVIDILNDPRYDGYHISFESDDPALIWSIDQHLMKRALLNFIHNALLHNASDVEVDIRLEAGKLIIEDNGNGIASDDLEQIFDRYYRGTNTKAQGTGLGMAIARDIITAHGGTVYLTSEQHQGTKIVIALKKQM